MARRVPVAGGPAPRVLGGRSDQGHGFEGSAMHTPLTRWQV